MASQPPFDDAEVVYVPAHPIEAGGRKDIAFETRGIGSGTQVALAYSSIARLVESLGHAQPWLAMPLGRLRQVMRSSGVTQVVVDPIVPAEAWRWAPEALEGR
jgi:hypothetical protein